MSKQEDLRSMFNAVYLDDAPTVTYNRFHKLMDDALAEARAEGVAHGNSLLDKAYAERDAALAKLAAVRDYAKSNTVTITPSDKTIRGFELACEAILAIIDGAPVKKPRKG